MEIEMARKTLKFDLPIQLGFFILQYAKLRMLQFYYDFMCKYVSRANFNYSYMDTDSAYMGISAPKLKDIIKEDMWLEYKRGLNDYCHDIDVAEAPLAHWFPRECCAEHTAFDKRTPLLFKFEYEGNEIIGLCSKTYAVSGDDDSVKFSCKGINPSSVIAPVATYADMLHNQGVYAPTNRGFRVKDNTVFTYEQSRTGLSYFYCKRKVLEDGINTEPLYIELCPETV